MERKTIFVPMIGAILIVFILLLFPVSFISRDLISAQSLQKSAPSKDLGKFKNIYLQNAAFADNRTFLPFFGSSTIGIFSRYHPVNYFTSAQMVPYLEGEPGVTSIIHVLNFSALHGSLTRKKLVIMLDTSEFMNPNGMRDDGFTKYYSPLSGYAFVFNHEIHPQDKRKIAAQLLRYSAVKKDSMLAAILEGMSHHDPVSKIKEYALLPVAYFRLKIMQKENFIHAFQALRKLKPYRQMPVPRNLTWAQLRAMAVKEAKGQTTNNPYGMLNGFYNSKIRKTAAKQKNSWKPNRHYLNSVAYLDMKVILEIFKQEHADPIFILIPQKGKWDDYRGFTQTYRYRLYNKMVNEVKSAGFQVLDYRNHEYDPYFLRDMWHLGWTGWVQVDQDLSKYYRH